MRTLVSTLTALSLLAPIGAGAFFQKTSELLHAIQYNGLPRSYEMEAHAYGEGTYISAWVRGAVEGKDLAKIKSWNVVTIDMNNNSDGSEIQARIRLEIRTVQQMAYVRLIGFEGTISDDVITVGGLVELAKWIAIPLDENWQEQGMAMAQSYLANASADERAMIDAFLDGVFAHTYARYGDGFTFSVKLNPNWMVNGARTLLETDSSDPSILALQEEWKDNVNFHTKIDTDFAGNFRFLKYYISVAHDGSSFVSQGTSQRTGVVRVEVPTETMTPAEFQRHLEMTDADDMLRQATENTPSRDMLWQWGYEKDWEEEWEENENVEWEEETRMPETPRQTEEEDAIRAERERLRRQATQQRGQRTRALPLRRDGTDSVPLRDTRSDVPCTATPGTVAYLQEVRKGVCALPDRSEYRTVTGGNARLKPYPASQAPLTGDGFQPAPSANTTETETEDTDADNISYIPEIDANDPIRGNPDAEISIVVYTDFGCPYCVRHHQETMQTLLKQYPNEVNWIYRHFPVGVYPHSQKAAEATECATELGGNTAFWAFVDLLFEEGSDTENLTQYATAIGLNERRFTSCLESGRYSQWVEYEKSGGIAGGLTGTPSSILIHHPTGKAVGIEGAQPPYFFAEQIDLLLAQ